MSHDVLIVGNDSFPANSYLYLLRSRDVFFPAIDGSGLHTYACPSINHADIYSMFGVD